jgi:hypothetical protein
MNISSSTIGLVHEKCKVHFYLPKRDVCIAKDLGLDEFKKLLIPSHRPQEANKMDVCEDYDVKVLLARQSINFGGVYRLPIDSNEQFLATRLPHNRRSSNSNTHAQVLHRNFRFYSRVHQLIKTDSISSTHNTLIYNA